METKKDTNDLTFVFANFTVIPWPDGIGKNHCHNQLVKCGFELVQGLECFYRHLTKNLFLSVYVDDFKLAGVRGNIAPMWKEIGKYLDLDPPTKFDNSVYLGCCQYDYEPIKAEISHQISFYNQSYADEECQFKTADQTENTELREAALQKML